MPDKAVLGQSVAYPVDYDPSLLVPIPRELQRPKELCEMKEFFGWDLWNAYELSWLSPSGRPDVAIGEFSFDSKSKNLIESKSLKLYLMSLNFRVFASQDQLQDVILNDLTHAANGSVEVRILELNPSRTRLKVSAPSGDCLDRLSVECNTYQVDKGLLLGAQSSSCTAIHESVYTNLFRSICPVTSQPDWATVTISYHGAEICREHLLKYLVSYRNHPGFHEDCVEKIWLDIWQSCSLETLTVTANFTRRGGLDINPVRSNGNPEYWFTRYVRQ